MKIKNGNDWGALVLRLSFGLSLLFAHGLPKWGRLFGDEPVKFFDPIGFGPEFALALALFAEVICTAMVVLGFLHRWATIPVIITLLVAAFGVHSVDDYSGMEKALLMALAFVALFFTGPGKFSLDHWLSTRNSSAQK